MEKSPRADSARYADNKPKSCSYCYFWQGKKHGCELKSCYYLLRKETEQKLDMDGTDCKGCPYGRHAPCIGYCLVKIMRELKVGRYAE